MGILLAKAFWPTQSETWFQRQMDALADHVTSFAALEPQAELLEEGVPTVRLVNPSQTPWRCGLQQLGFSALFDTRQPAERLASAIADARVSSVLVHYLDFAVRFRDVLINCGKPVFVHCHGYDTLWDLRFHDRPDVLVHSVDYAEQARDLSRSVTLIANSQHLKQRLLAAGIS